MPRKEKELVDYEEVLKTMTDWINEAGSVTKVAKRMGLQHTPLYRVYNGKEPMGKKRFEKWKALWAIGSKMELDSDYGAADVLFSIEFAEMIRKYEEELLSINEELSKFGCKLVITKIKPDQ